MLKQTLAAAQGTKPADLVLKNGFIVNVFTEEIITGDVAICGSTIVGIGDYEGEQMLDCTGKYLVPGFIDAHMHMESSMVLPNELSKVLLRAGTTTIIADPHEMVNVAGTAALDWVLQAVSQLPMDAYITLPSSVPSTDFETNGAGEFTAQQMAQYLSHPNVLGLGEVMRMQDVCDADERMLEKLQLFERKPIDGHAPGLSGKGLQAYRAAGIQNDHECAVPEDAIEKLRAGFALFLREGTGAKNVSSLLEGIVKAQLPLDRCMFCTDDKHLAEIEAEGHIGACVRKAIALGVPSVKAYKMASWNTAQFYGFRHLGAIGAGYQADLLVLDNLEDAKPVLTFKNGFVVSDAYFTAFSSPKIPASLCDTVRMPRITKADLSLPVQGQTDVIELVPHQLLTRHLSETVPTLGTEFAPNSVYNKLCVVERHGKTNNVKVAVLKGFGIEHGAIASTVAHDSHNLIVAGDNDSDILAAIDCVRDMHGGFAVVTAGHLCGSLPLSFCGLMSTRSYPVVEEALQTMLKAAHVMGVSRSTDPFITLSFLALPVIPELRLTDKGLYDVVKNQFI